MTDDLDEIVQKLKDTNINEHSDEIINYLNKIIESADVKKQQQHDPHDDLRTAIVNHLNQFQVSNVQIAAAKCIAEITKTDSQRRCFTDTETIQILIDILNRQLLANNEIGNLELTIQTCRALGNICYNNDVAQDILLKMNGDSILIHLLDYTMQSNNSDNEMHLQFIKVRCGLISNYLVGDETIAKRAIDLKIMEKIECTIDHCLQNIDETEDLLLNTLPPLSILTENVSDLNFEPSINRQLVKILEISKNPDIAEMCLDLLHYQAENDDVKLLLAKEGLCETIYRLLEKYKDLASTNEARALMKLACDLVVLILTGDEAMHYLYSTPFVKYIEDWLESCDLDLLTTGVLALGNFARTDSHCIYMVENNIMKKLLDILAKNNGTGDDMRLQHALLSALRNLVIPKPNKPAIIEAGLVETILPMLEIHQPPVVFKLLGTLRMTVDGQEKLAMDLLRNKTLINQLVHWSKSSDYASVMGESLRLMAWLIKHAYCLHRDPATVATKATHPLNDSSLRAFVQIDNAVECMVDMLTSQHLVMQNEALIALSIIATVLCSENQKDINLNELLIQCQLGQKMNEFISKSADSMTKEIVENLQTFMSLLRRSEMLVKHLNDHNIDELLKSIPILTEYCTL